MTEEKDKDKIKIKGRKTAMCGTCLKIKPIIIIEVAKGYVVPHLLIPYCSKECYNKRKASDLK